MFPNLMMGGGFGMGGFGLPVPMSDMPMMPMGGMGGMRPGGRQGFPGLVQPGRGPFMPMQNGLGGMGGMRGARGRGGPPGADFDPSRNVPRRGRSPSPARPRNNSYQQGRSPSPGPRRAWSPFQAPRAVRFNPQHEGARFDQHEPPFNMQQANPHAYGLNPEPRPRTIAEMFRDHDVPVVDFAFVKALAPGGMSTAINLVRGRRDGKLYIEKRIRTDAGRRKPAVREVRTLNKITRDYGVGRNLNTLVLSKAIRDGNLWSLILDYCDRGSLMDFLKKGMQTRRTFQELAIWNVLQGVAHGLAFLHDGLQEIKHGKVHDKVPGWDAICHLDIKPQNIFLHSQGGPFSLPRIVLADFGCAVALSDLKRGDEQHAMQPFGTPAWYPPEGDLRNPQYYGTKTDMWALGLTIFVLCRLQEMPNIQAYPRDNLCGSQYGQRLNAFVRSLTSSDSKRRPPARHIASQAMHILREKAQGRQQGHR